MNARYEYLIIPLQLGEQSMGTHCFSSNTNNMAGLHQHGLINPGLGFLW